jgi:hypothetical protein
MPPDATLAYVMSTLARPEDYVRGMLRNLYDCKREHGGASARLGLTGGGVSPHYRIEFPLQLEALPNVSNGIFGAFDGRSHKLIDWIDEASQSEGSILWDEHWSTNPMGIGDVTAFLAYIRRGFVAR